MFLAIYFLKLGKDANNLFKTFLSFALSVSLLWLAYRLITVFIEFLYAITDKTDTDLDDHVMPIVERILKIIVISFGVLVIMQNFGINVMSLVAGLGIGGLAFALAAKDMASNMFGSLAIFMDRPFKKGDRIRVAGIDGFVEEIGFRTTKIRSLFDSLVTIPNGIIVNTQIDNLSERKIKSNYSELGIRYDTPVDKIEELLKGIKDIITNDPDTDKNWYKVRVKEFANSQIVLMIIFAVNFQDWDVEMEAIERVILNVIRLTRDLEIQLSPTESVAIDSFTTKIKTRSGG